MVMNPCCPGRTATKRMVIGGREIGITDLDDILDVGFALNLFPESVIREAMMQELRSCNYVPRGAEKEYEDGIWTTFVEVRDRRKRGMPDREPKCTCGDSSPGRN